MPCEKDIAEPGNQPNCPKMQPRELLVRLNLLLCCFHSGLPITLSPNNASKPFTVTRCMPGTALCLFWMQESQKQLLAWKEMGRKGHSFFSGSLQGFAR